MPARVLLLLLLLSSEEKKTMSCGRSQEMQMKRVGLWEPGCVQEPVEAGRLQALRSIILKDNAFAPK